MTREFDFRFFHESVSPGPLNIPLGQFRFLSKIRGDINELMFTTGVNDTDDNLFHGIAGVNVLCILYTIFNKLFGECILLGPPGCAQVFPLREPGPPRFFWWYENSD